MLTCSYCGRDNEDSAAHCRECGTSLTPTPPPVITASSPRPQISRSDVLVFKRLALAFGLVMVIHALFAFGPRVFFDAIPPRVAGLFYLGCVWLAPAMIYLVALYGAPLHWGLQTGVLRILRMALLTSIAFGLSFASMFAFFAFWFVASIVFGFPFRQA